MIVVSMRINYKTDSSILTFDFGETWSDESDDIDGDMDGLSPPDKPKNRIKEWFRVFF